MSLTDPQKVDAYFGPEPATIGSDGAGPTLGAGFRAVATNATTSGLVEDVYLPVPGTWSGSGIDWSVSAAGVLTYTGAIAQAFTLQSWGIIGTAGIANAQLAWSFDGATPGDPGASLNEHQVTGDKKPSGGAFFRRLFPSGATAQLHVLNFSSDDEIDCSNMVVLVSP